jgi:AraC-like DNA-binding protein
VDVISDPQTWTRSMAAAGIPILTSPGANDEEFRAQMVTGRLGQVRVAEFTTPAGQCFRDPVEPGQGRVQIELISHGRVYVEQEERQAQLAAGDLVMIDPDRPLQVTSTATRHLTVLMPQQLLSIEPDQVPRLAGIPLPGAHGSGALVSALVRTAVRTLGTFGPEEAVRSGAAIADLVTATLATRLKQSPDETLRAQIRAFIATRLADPDLSPAMVAAAHHLSLRRLQKLFQDEPLAVAALIRHRRLERCRIELLEPHPTVALVAARWGFSDPAHFSRLFKATYGQSPSDYRRDSSSRRARIGMAPAGAGRHDRDHE